MTQDDLIQHLEAKYLKFKDLTAIEIIKITATFV